MFADDDILVELDFAERLEQSECMWAQCGDTVLCNGPVSGEKKKIEALRTEEEILVGFHVNVQTKRIRLPDANIDGDRATLCKS